MDYQLNSFSVVVKVESEFMKFQKRFEKKREEW